MKINLLNKNVGGRKSF